MLHGEKKQGLTVICYYLLSIFILSGFITDEHKVPLMAVDTAQVVHQVRAILQTSVPLSRKTTTELVQHDIGENYIVTLLFPEIYIAM